MSGDASHAPMTASKVPTMTAPPGGKARTIDPLRTREAERQPGLALFRAQRNHPRGAQPDDDETRNGRDDREHGETDRENIDRLTHPARRDRRRLDLVDHSGRIIADTSAQLAHEAGHASRPLREPDQHDVDVAADPIAVLLDERTRQQQDAARLALLAQVDW